MNGLLTIEPGVLALRCRQWSVVFSARALWAIPALLAGLAMLSLVALCAGPTWLSVFELRAALTGSGPTGLQLLVNELRLPRLIAGLLAGAALGCAGCLIQALSRNRLATPDILGVSDGAALGIFIGLIAGGTGLMGPWWSGPLGALGALCLLALAAGRIGPSLLIVGVGVASLLRALTELALARQELMHASALYSWSVGSLTGRGYEAALPLAAALLLLLPLASLLSHRLTLLGLGSDLARALGLPLRATQWQALLLAVLLAGLAVGVCGPIAFVALAAPYLATRLLGAIAPGGSALCGAMLVVLADALGRLVLHGAELPAGVVCNLLGGPFLLWLLLNEGEGKST
ncbi:MAG TPA: iron ABC transporter permease [Telluria sp.]